MKHKYSKEEIENFVTSENLSYQRIALPFGLSTPGIDRPDVMDVLFDNSIFGKTLLDVGTYLGYFCLQSLERGATSATGIEIDEDRLRQARTIADMKVLSPIYIQADIESFDPDDNFDVVLCLNVLHHLSDPIHVLRKLARICREELVLEVASFGGHDIAKSGVGWAVGRMLSRRPVVQVGEGIALTGRSGRMQKYFFSRSAIRNILYNHMKLFSSVEFYHSRFKGRFIVKAKRRRIDRLLVVSGITSAGKSTFLNNIFCGHLSSDIIQMLPYNVRDWPQIGANALFSDNPKTIDGKQLGIDRLPGLVFHYDILRPITCGNYQFKKDQALDILQCAEEVSVVLLSPSQAEAIARLKKSEFSGSVDGAKDWIRKGWRRIKNWLPAGFRGLAKRFGFAVRINHVLGRGGDDGHVKRLLQNYEKEGWIRRREAEWVAYLRSVKPDVNVIEIKDY